MKNSVIIYLLFTSLILLDSSCKESVNEIVDDRRIEKVFNLPYELYESSGLIYFDSLFWSFNDSDNEPILYGFSTTNGNIEREITFDSVYNTDWEDITQDKNNIYIGDFGNNYGDRQDLRIYIIPKKSLTSARNQSLIPDSITFYYCDQSDFTESFQYTEFDCEAMFNIGDSLYLITKDWLNEKAALYSIPKVAGNYMAVKHTTLTSSGLVTGADYDSTTNDLAICGYNDYIPFVAICNSFNAGNAITSSNTLYTFSELAGIQVEGITFNDGGIYLSSENSSISQTLFTFTP